MRFVVSTMQDSTLNSMKKYPKKCVNNSLRSSTVYEDSTHCDNGWFGDIKSLAKSTKETILPAFEGLAGIVHRSALSVAAEFAQLERDAELEAERWKDESSGENHREQKRHVLPLPWEVKRRNGNEEDSANSFVEDESFKNRILQLSTTEETFLEPYGAGEADDFLLTDQRIHLIRRILHLDENLAAIHAKISGKFEDFKMKHSLDFALKGANKCCLYQY